MKSLPKTLIILAPGFAAGESDSTCLPAQQQLLLSLREQFPGITLIVLAFQYPFAARPYYWNGIQVIPFNGRNRGKFYRLVLWGRVWRRLKAIRKEHTVIGLFSFWYGECALVGKWFGKRNHIAHFTWLLGQDARAGNKYAERLHPHPGELVAISDSVAREFEKHYHIRPAFIIPNAIDPHLFAEAVEERDIDILGVGSLIPLKRYGLFIEIISEIKKRLPHVKAVLCGKGPERDHLQEKINALNLEDTVTLAGELPYPAILALMQRSRILLHPSSYEGLSGVCLEALYAGAHVVSFHNPKNEWVRHWHIASDIQEMVGTTYDLLSSTNMDHMPVLPYAMKDTAAAVMHLFSK